VLRSTSQHCVNWYRHINYGDPSVALHKSTLSMRDYSLSLNTFKWQPKSVNIGEKRNWAEK